MKQVSSIDLHFLVKEFKVLENGKINNIYSQDKKTFSIDIYAREKGKIYLIIDDCKYIYLSNNKKSSNEPSGFCMFLRKKLKNSIIKNVEQIGIERIIKLTIEVKEVKDSGKENNQINEYYLYIELFNKGNIILCDKDNKIIGLAEVQRWSDRELKVNNIYQPPKSENSYREINPNILIEEVKSNKSLVKALASKFSMGGIYAEEICLRSEIDKDAEGVSEEEANLIIEKINEILNQDLFPKIVYKNEINNIDDDYDNDINNNNNSNKSNDDINKINNKKTIDFQIHTISPIELEVFKNKESKSCSSISICYEEALVEEKSLFKDSKKLAKYEEKIAHLNKRIEEQEKYIEELGEVEISNRDKGNKIYENYGDVNDLMNEVKAKLKEVGLDEVKKGYKDSKKVKIMNYDKILVNV